MDRRRFLLGVAAGAMATLAGCAELHSLDSRGKPITQSSADTPSIPDALPVMPSSPTATPARPRPHVLTSPGLLTAPSPVLDRLPGAGTNVALTIDDGVNSEVVAAYVRFAQDTDARFTFFLNGINPSWTDNAVALRPLVDSGQIQLGNHTWAHPDLRQLSGTQIRDELNRNDAFIQNTYGVSARPYFRPPYGFYNDEVRRIAREEGYPNCVMWYGSFGDSGLLTDAQLLANAQQWIAQQRIIIGHANHPTITHLYDQIVDILNASDLTMVTLNDIFKPT